MRGAGAFQLCDMTAFLEIVLPTPGAHPGPALIMKINNVPLTGWWGHHMRLLSAWYTVGAQINWSSLPPPTGLGCSDACGFKLCR